MSKDGGPAFPYEGVEHVQTARNTWTTRNVESAGMTLRDYFAASALQGYGQNMLVMNNAIEGWKDTGRGGQRETCIAEYIAGLAYEVADAMLAAREKQ
jgi:hypothetical protein